MQKLIEKLSKYKKEEICIISDFDDTLTKGIIDGNKRGSNSFSVFPNNPDLLGEEYLMLTNKLFKHYYDIEQDPKVTNSEKEKLMLEWWEKEFELYRAYGLTRDTFIEIIQNKLIELKDKVEVFLKLTNKLNIPTIIFSAGIYELIHGFLRKINSNYENTHVVANLFEFDKEGNFVSTKGDIIHSQNKTFKELSHLPVYKELKSKKLCILIGDSVSDLKMVEGSNFEKVIKIGFLNKIPGDKGYEERLKAHEENYDFVIDGREDFSKVNNLLKEIN